jgi:ketosteroid isomerase-like protein
MTTEYSRANEETEIRTLLHDQANAIRAKNTEGALAPYAPNIVRFDLAPPLATAGSQALGKSTLEEWFATWRGPIGFELRDLTVTQSGDPAFCHGFVRISGTKVDGEHNDVWVRQTVCFRKIGGAWKIIHEHTSVPFYMDGSYRAAVDLEP